MVLPISVGGWPYHRMMDSYDFLAIGGVAYGGKITGKVAQVLFDIVRACAAVVNALVAVIRLVRDIAKDKKQKSNRPDQG